MTSIEFLEQNVTLNISVYDWLLLIQQAKEMHSKEIIVAYNKGYLNLKLGDDDAGKEYY